MDLESVLTQQLGRFSQEPQLLRQIQTLLRLLRGELPTESVQAAADEPSEDDLVKGSLGLTIQPIFSPSFFHSSLTSHKNYTLPNYLLNHLLLLPTP